MKKINFLIILAVLLSWGLALMVFPYLPDSLPTHWGINGQPDAFGPKEYALFIGPALLSTILLLFYFLPKIDPFHENHVANADNWQKMRLAMLFLMFFVQITTLAQYFDLIFDMGVILSAGIGIFFYLTGWAMKGIKKNWFFGIRTPWTLANERVWEKTHNIGSDLFKAFGICLLVMCALSFYGFFASTILFPLLMAFVIALCIWSFIYPYRLWKNEFRK